MRIRDEVFRNNKEEIDNKKIPEIKELDDSMRKKIEEIFENSLFEDIFDYNEARKDSLNGLNMKKEIKLRVTEIMDDEIFRQICYFFEEVDRIMSTKTVFARDISKLSNKYSDISQKLELIRKDKEDN